MNRRIKTQKTAEQGFTIVELMIATSILSTILVLSTVMMISIGRLYYKGINQARVQANVRNIVDDVAQQLKLHESPQEAANPIIAGSTTIKAYCVGSTRYSYVLDKQIGAPADGRIPHVLWRDNVPATGCRDPANLADANLTSGTELVGPNSRLTAFTFSLASPYTLSVAVAYGDDDLLNLSGMNTSCKASRANQFCATAALTTTVVKRLKSR